MILSHISKAVVVKRPVFRAYQRQNTGSALQPVDELLIHMRVLHPRLRQWKRIVQEHLRPRTQGNRP
jgi:hypothetical protein